MKPIVAGDRVTWLDRWGRKVSGTAVAPIAGGWQCRRYDRPVAVMQPRIIGASKPPKPRTWKARALALDPGCTLSGGRQNLGGRDYDLYQVKDSAGVVIGWNDGNDQGPSWAWMGAYGTLRRRAAQ